jgi:hypothetical protein
VNRLVRGVHTSVWALRLVVLLGPLVALWSAAPSGHVPSPFVVALVAVLGIGYAARPENFSGPIVMAVVLLWWALSIGSAMPVGALVAAAGLVAAHVAAVLLGYGPPQMPVDTDLALRWAFRAAASWLAALVVWVAADAYSGHATPTSFWLVGLATALVGAVVAAVVVPARDLRDGS